MLRIIKTLWTLLSHGQRKRGIYVILLLSFLSVLDFFNVAIFLPLLAFILDPETIASFPFLNRVIGDGQSGYTAFIITFATGILIFSLLKAWIGTTISRIKAQYAFGISRAFAHALLKRFINSSYHQYKKSDYSKILNHITHYPLTFANNIILPVATIFSEFLVCALIIASIAFFDIKTLLFLSLLLIPMLLLYNRRKKTLSKIRETIQDKYPLVTKYALLIVEGLIEIKTYCREKFFQQKFDSTYDSLSRAFIKDHVIQSGTTRLIEVITATAICLIVIITLLKGEDHYQTLMLLAVYVSASFRVIPSINRILLAQQQMHTHAYIVDELRREEYPIAQADIVHDDHATVFTTSIEISHLKLEYPGAPAILRNGSLYFHKGDKVGIVGKSGEGKSTLLLALLGFIPTPSSIIKIDGQRIEGIGKLQALMGYVPQQPYILDASLAENVAFGIPKPEIDESRIIEILKALDLTELVQQLPDGISTNIGERGGRLSGGQLQRLAIARALYFDAAILLLDEPTNQLDRQNELEILKVLNQLSFQGKTIIMVTHKPNVEFFTTMYQLEDGQLNVVAMAENHGLP